MENNKLTPGQKFTIVKLCLVTAGLLAMLLWKIITLIN